MPGTRHVTTRFLYVAVAATLCLLAPPSPAPAQDSPKTYRIAILSNAPKSNKLMEQRLDVFRHALRDLGYVPGRNTEMFERYPTSMTDRAAQQAVLAGELVALKPDVIFTFSSPATDMLEQATKTIPIVVGVSADPFVKDFSHPTGNITGLSSDAENLVGKQLELFHETLPGLKKVAILWNPEHHSHAPSVKEAERAAKTLGLDLVPVPAASPGQFAGAFQRIADLKADGVVVLRGGLFVNSRPKLSNLANAHGIPSMFGHPVEAQAGGLMSYGTSVSDLFRRAASYVDKILKGAKPGDLPVERPTKFVLVINLKTAHKLGVKIPPTILLRADQVIE